MKICFLCPKAYALFNKRCQEIIGGSEVMFYYLANEFASRYHARVSVVVADYGQPSREEIGEVCLLRSFRFSDNIVKKIVGFIRALKDAGADIYIHSALTPLSGILALYSRLWKKKFIYRLASDSELDGTYRRERGPLITFLSQIVFRLSHAILVQNTYQLRMMKIRGVKNIYLLKNGCYLNNRQTAKRSNVVLWVGRSVGFKRPELFLRLAEDKKQMNFLMISAGRDTNGLHRRLREQSKAIKNLAFIDYVPFYEVDEYYKRASVFVCTSQVEGAPMTFVQAASFGLPIVSLYVDPDGILRDGGGGILCNGDFSLFENKVEEIMNNGPLYHELSEHAYQFAQRHYDIVKIADGFYRHLLTL